MLQHKSQFMGDAASARSRVEEYNAPGSPQDDSKIQRTVALVVPAYRPSSELPELLREIRAADRTHQIRTAVVIDDGSGPEYEPIFEDLESQEGVIVLRHAVNLGKGAALKTGFNHVLVNFPDVAGVVTADADGQHAVDDILEVARALAETPHEMILGVRSFAGEVPLRSRIGNGITRRIFQAFTGASITDTQTGLRGWPRVVCRESLRVAINGYDFELECLLRAHNGAGGTAVSIRQVPIKTIYLDGNRASHFNPIRDSMRVYFVFIRYCGAAMMATVLDSLFFYMVRAETNNLIEAQIAGRMVAMSVAFVINRNLVFHSDSRIVTSLAKYVTLVAVVGFISYLILTYLHRTAGIPIVPAKLIAEGLLFVANFAIQRQLVFVRSKLSKPEAA